MVTPHRPMFLAGAAWAIVGVGIVGWDTGIDLTHSPLGNRWAWHGHEMVFGFAAAMFAGYALTAMPSWSSGARMSSRSVALLLMLWLLARLTAAGAFGTDPALVAVGTAGFMGFVTLTLACAALRPPSIKGAGFAAFALTMTCIQIAVLQGRAMPFLPVLGFAALLSVVGGRMVAAFTWNRLSCTAPYARRFNLAKLFGYASAAALLVALILDTFGIASNWVFAGLVVAATTEAARLLIWLSTDTFRDSLLNMLRLAYFWLPIGLLLVALSRADFGDPPDSAALHALTAGAISCSIYAVASRAVARRDNQLRPPLIDLVGFAFLSVAAAMRVFTPNDAQGYAVVPLIWCIAWAIFLLRHSAALLHPEPRPVFSGPKRSTDGESESA
ncbi:NnrS family protein [Ruegeria sp. Ofav3-42]|uniref:NnrS family protein n=1 Tax=Ruegeria sp. Ofav3-42 TaxID=2917759 RepID=UPI001EF69BE1|nr:NnrS family protein [Ruegeria sp. Ofav3-42]MCG7519830.1 NnrS family protein [Ruegeria sp. Ofav3-42]